MRVPAVFWGSIGAFRCQFGYTGCLRELNAVDNQNPPTETAIYPFKSKTDAPYSVKEDDLRAAIYIPESFQYGKNGKKPVVLVPGTGVPAGLTYYFSFGKLAEVPEADVVWVNMPSTSSGDVQVTSEYVAYAINYISSVTESNVATMAWSQGNLNIQWSFKYWSSTSDVVDNFIAISPDFRGTVLADAVCPLLTGIFCTPAFFQQTCETDFITALRADGGDSAQRAAQMLRQYSTMPEELAYPITTRRPFAPQPTGSLYTHEGMLYSPLTWALAADALRYGGPGDISRIDKERVCADVIAPQLSPDDLSGSEELILILVAESLAFTPKPLKELPVAGYAL